MPGERRARSHPARAYSNLTFKFIILSLFFLVLTLFMFRNIFDGAYLTGTDSMWTVLGPNMQAVGGSFFSSWDYFRSVGLLSYPLPSYAASNALFLSVLQMTAWDFAKLQLLGSFWLAGMLSFYVLRAMTSSDKAAFLGSLVYVGNGAFMNQVIEGHISFVAAYPFLILIFYLFYEAYDHGITKKTIALPALLLLYGGASPPHMVFLAATMIISYAAAETLYGAISRRRGGKVHRIGSTALLTLALVLPIAYIMLVLGGESMYDTSYTIEMAANSSNWALGAISLGGAEITNAHSYYGPVGPLLIMATQALAVPLFVFALLSLFIDKYRKLTVPLWLATAFTILMSMGPNSPLGFVFTFVFDHVPLVDSFRSFSRFSMVSAVFYSILIAITVANWRDISEKARQLKAFSPDRPSKRRWTGGARRASREFSITLTVVLLIASLSGLSICANGDVIRGFEPPKGYTEPFEYIETVDADGLYYKIYTLPMTGEYYQHHASPAVSGYGYPKGTTLDPGTFLPAMINERAMSRSVPQPHLWTGIRIAMEDRQFGYQSTLDLLGSSAAVKYVVDQWYSPDEEKGYLSNMSGGTTMAEFDSGARVVLVDTYTSPVKAQNGLVVGSGGLDTMYLLLGAGIFDPSSNSYASLQWTDDDLEDILGASDLIVIRNGDLVELGYEVGYLDDVLINLSGEVNDHREDPSSQWVPSADYGVERMSVSTAGASELTIKPNTQVDHGSSVKLRVLFGPGQGVLRAEINGRWAGDIDTSAPFTGWEWMTIEVPNDIRRIDSITFTGSPDGKSVTISDAAIFTSGTEERLASQVRDLLKPYSSKVGYAYTPLNIFLHDPLIELGNWTRGNGVLSSGGNIWVPVSTVFDNDLRLSVYAPDWGARDAMFDGIADSGSVVISGAYRYELGTVAAGEHDLRVLSDGLYGMTLLPDYEINKVAPTISFERISPTEWHVSVTNASGPFILKFSEGTSEFWRLDGTTATWFRSDYLANAFIVNGAGDMELALVFSKQSEYNAFLYVYVFAIVASTGVVAAAYAYAKVGVQERKKGAQREKRRN